MRLLLTSLQGAGHFHPLLPFGRAAAARGDDVLVAAPPRLEPAVAAAGFGFTPVGTPDEVELRTVWDGVPSLPEDERERAVIGDVFVRLDAGASLPAIQEAVSAFEPDLVLRDMHEYAGALAAEQAGVACARVGISLAAEEDQTLRIAAGPLDTLRRENGLPPDPDAELVRNSPYLTCFPPSLEDPDRPGQPHAIHARDPAWDEPQPPLPDWWDGSDAPLVYVTLGSVAGSISQMRGLYGMVLGAVAGLPARVLLTVGPDVDPATFGDTPPNVHVERWIPQAQVLAQAAAVVCHGGSGSVVGALTAGLPLVVLPLFADQPHNAERVAALGAGLVVAPPDPGALVAATERVLREPAFAAQASAIAVEARRQPTAGQALELLAGLAAA
jgi:UDP:flavonoid glycosyltransferase YjiC (YdhE family)